MGFNLIPLLSAILYDTYLTEHIKEKQLYPITFAFYLVALDNSGLSESEGGTPLFSWQSKRSTVHIQHIVKDQGTVEVTHRCNYQCVVSKCVTNITNKQQ